jgi:riboflavin biosynthesis pyrimidine reductase
VFYTPEDRVVSVPAIEERAPERNRVAYEGGHELFSSPTREEYVDRILAAVDRGLEGVTDPEDE